MQVIWWCEILYNSRVHHIGNNIVVDIYFLLLDIKIARSCKKISQKRNKIEKLLSDWNNIVKCVKVDKN